jgi:hypothetical protein
MANNVSMIRTKAIKDESIFSLSNVFSLQSIVEIQWNCVHIDFHEIHTWEIYKSYLLNVLVLHQKVQDFHEETRK